MFAYIHIHTFTYSFIITGLNVGHSYVKVKLREGGGARWGGGGEGQKSDLSQSDLSTVANGGVDPNKKETNPCWKSEPTDSTFKFNFCSVLQQFFFLMRSDP